MKTCPVCDTPYPDNHTTCPTDGAVLIASHELAPGRLVRGKYRIVRKLGQGGMGVVYLADDILLGMPVALKFLAGELEKDPRFIKRFRTEARAAFQLRHPNIVEVTNLDQAEDGSLYIAMEFVDGPSLRAVLERAHGPLAIARALDIARGIAHGLAAAHAQGMVHRDIKPENILLALAAEGREKPKILDFGIVAVTEGVTGRSLTHGMLLTPDYAAPEQWLEMPSAEIDGRTDLYALGCVIYEMLTGNTPFHAHSTSGWMKKHLEETPRPPSALRLELANWQGLDALALRLLAKDRAQRPRDAAEFLQLLDGVQPVPAADARETVVDETALRPVAIPVRSSNRPEAEPPAQAVAGAHPQSKGFPLWGWGAVVLLALLAAFATWRLIPPHQQSRQALAPVAQPSPAPATEFKPAAMEPGLANVDKQSDALLKQKRNSDAATQYDQACTRGSGDACNQLGYMYFVGEGVKQDQSHAASLHSRAESLFSKSCDAGSGQACTSLGEMYDSCCEGVVQDFPHSAALYSKACDAGYAKGCRLLGTAYEEGKGVKKDYSQAAAFHSKACDAGEPYGCDEIATQYELGWGVTEDRSKSAALRSRAATLFSHGCDTGESFDCVLLADFYKEGKGVKKDYSQAAALYSKACDAGQTSACKNLGDLYQAGRGVERNPAKAKELFAKACPKGTPAWECEIN